MQFTRIKVFLIRFDGELFLVASLSQIVHEGVGHGWRQKVVDNMTLNLHYHIEERIVEFVNGDKRIFLIFGRSESTMLSREFCTNTF